MAQDPQEPSRSEPEDGEHVELQRDGTLMRSGHFAAGQTVGEWTTYDLQGRVHTVTSRKPVAGTGQ